MEPSEQTHGLLQEDIFISVNYLVFSTYTKKIKCHPPLPHSVRYRVVLASVAERWCV